MTDTDSFALAPRAPSVLEKAEGGRRRVLASMVAETLSLARGETPAQPAADLLCDESETLENWCRNGDDYWSGRGVPRDYAEAANWYRRAAERGHRRAQFNIGCCYYHGHGVAQDYAEAVAWFLKAAELGLAQGQYTLGCCYMGGTGVPKDCDEAEKWFRRASEQGHEAATNELASLKAANEASTAANEALTELAVRLATSGAQRGQPTAQFELGAFYLSGTGVAKDSIEAYKWFRLAAEQGHRAAADEVGLLEALLSPDQVQEAERRYRDFRART